MRALQYSEHYTDKGPHAVVTRTRIVNVDELTVIAAHRRRTAEDLEFSANPSTLDNCRIAGAMLGWALNLAPTRIGTKFGYQAHCLSCKERGAGHCAVFIFQPLLRVQGRDTSKR